MNDNPMTPIQDAETLQYRVNADKCTTCLFNPSRMENGMREVIDDARKRDSFVQCHETYRWGYFIPAKGVKTSMCRGYWDAYRREQYGLRLLDDCGAMVDVPTPPTPEDTRPHELHGSVHEGTFMVRPKKKEESS
jgi:hypothetical protein